MDPIKVDFSSSGSNKGNSGKTVVIPPNKAGLKIAINLVVTAIIAAVTYYFYLPAFNFKAVEMYIYFGIVLAAYCATAFVTSGALISPEYTPYARKRTVIPMIIPYGTSVYPFCRIKRVLPCEGLSRNHHTC